MSCFEVGKGKRADSLFSDQVSVKGTCSNQVLKGSTQHSAARCFTRRRGSSPRAPAAHRQSGFHGNCPALCLRHPVQKYSFISTPYRYIILVQIKIDEWSRKAVKPRIIYVKIGSRFWNGCSLWLCSHCFSQIIDSKCQDVSPRTSITYLNLKSCYRKIYPWSSTNKPSRQERVTFTDLRTN